MKKVRHTSDFSFGIYWWILKNLEKHNFDKMKKYYWRYHQFTHVCQKLQSFEVQFLRYRVRQNFFLFLANFCHLHPWSLSPTLSPLKLRIPKFWKKNLEYLIISNLFNKIHDHMIYAYSDMECNRHDFLWF